MDEKVDNFGAVPDVAIAMSVLGRLDMTERCLATLLEDPERPAYEIAIVDNGSRDNTPGYLRKFKEKVASLGKGDSFRVLTNPETTCLAAAWNQAIRATHAPWVVVVSNDILLPRGWWAGLKGAMEAHGLALASPFPLEGELPRDFPAWAAAFMRRNRERYWRDYSFVVFAFRRGTFEKIGGLDENFLVGGFEDTDYVYRLRAADLKYGIVGAAALYHYGSATMEAFKQAGDLHAEPNPTYFIRK